MDVQPVLQEHQAPYLQHVHSLIPMPKTCTQTSFVRNYEHGPRTLSRTRWTPTESPHGLLQQEFLLIGVALNKRLFTNLFKCYELNITANVQLMRECLTHYLYKCSILLFKVFLTFLQFSTSRTQHDEQQAISLHFLLKNTSLK